MESSDRKSIIGWNWGTFKFDDDEFKFDVKGVKCLSLPYSTINFANATNKNEVAVELDIDHVKEE